MSKEFDTLKELKHWKEINTEKGVTWIPVFVVEKVEKDLLELKTIKEAKSSEALKCLEKFFNNRKIYEPNNTYIFECIERLTAIKQSLLKEQSLEQENEILKEIIKSLFDRGCPLHQYTDKDLGLTIEVDDDCSVMHLGEFKGVDLDKKLKEVLE